MNVVSLLFDRLFSDWPIDGVILCIALRENHFLPRQMPCSNTLPDVGKLHQPRRRAVYASLDEAAAARLVG